MRSQDVVVGSTASRRDVACRPDSILFGNARLSRFADALSFARATLSPVLTVTLTRQASRSHTTD